MKKNFALGLVLLLISVFVVLVGCEDIDLDQLYICYNNSSYSVTVTDSSGSGIVIGPGTSKSIYLVGDTTLNDISYSPSNLVSVSLSGNTITFRDIDQLYTCYNNSSYSVTVTDSSGNGVVIPAGGSGSIYLAGNTTDSAIDYVPSNFVSVSLTGKTIIFRNK
jgi:ABC-type Fe3+-hydroxamate transport system substrate-binding protein